MVANLPYNVATPLVVDCLERAPMIDRFLVMVQREVGERLAAGPGTKAYGAVSVKVAYYAEAAVVGHVPATVFVPQPNVESALVRLVRRREPPVVVPDVDRLFAFVRAGFATRRKTLRRALAPVLGDAVPGALERAGIEANARAEQLTLEHWAALARAADGC
jgi:16S rRNA (adenine1518-N6/adenine1519-N6)-dimethyltransferase